MAGKKKNKQEELAQTIANETPVSEQVIISEPEEIKEEIKKEKPKKIKTPKFKIGDIAFISKDADSDLNGFKLFPQYKKYTYTVEAYDEKSGVYTLRRLNLSLHLPEELILAPEERAHDPLHRRQF